MLLFVHNMQQTTLQSLSYYVQTSSPPGYVGKRGNDLSRLVLLHIYRWLSWTQSVIWSFLIDKSNRVLTSQPCSDIGPITQHLITTHYNNFVQARLATNNPRQKRQQNVQSRTQKNLNTDTMSGLTEMEDEEEKQFGSGGMESNPPIEMEEIEDKEKQLKKVVAKSNPPQLIVQNNPTKSTCANSQYKHAPHIKSTLRMQQQISQFSKTFDDHVILSDRTMVCSTSQVHLPKVRHLALDPNEITDHISLLWCLESFRIHLLQRNISAPFSTDTIPTKNGRELMEK